jgi:hypothetical protein
MRVVTGVAVHCFPSADGEFREATQQLVAESWERIHSTERLIAEVQATLRERYPEAIVRPRDAQAEIGHPEVQTLYAFRDGRAA